MYLLGCDIGCSSVKVSIVDAESGEAIGVDCYPKEEAPIMAVHPGWAEQNPEDWWLYFKNAVMGVLAKSGIPGDEISAIGIAYQMHGLVMVDKNKNVIRPSIIWCDSRAVAYGERAFHAIGEEQCLAHLLNSPGNFTASKLAWVKEYEPENYRAIYKIMFPGDYIAMRLTGDIVTTVPGLSEGIFWDFQADALSQDIFSYFGFSEDIIPTVCPTFGIQGELLASVAAELGLKKGIPITYRAGDQINNALSLHVLNPGEVAATAGLSGVVYGVNSQLKCDPLSRINTFAHVNHTKAQPRLGALLCVNGVGILNAWVKRTIAPAGFTYDQLNELAASVPIGSEGVSILPFGNGAERMLQNKQIDCAVFGLNFNTHGAAHIARAAQEGIVFAFKYGMEIMSEMGIDIDIIRVCNSSMFQSPILKEALAGVTGTLIEVYDTSSAEGAAKAAGVSAGIYSSPQEAFASLRRLEEVEPDGLKADRYCGAFDVWKDCLNKMIGKS